MKAKSNWAELAFAAFILIWWIFGIAVATMSGFWITVCAIFVPPAAWVMLALWILDLFK